nr:hypothetical protein [Desulfobulbaceae bacterium]
MFNLLEIFLIIAAVVILCVPVFKWALKTITSELAHFQLFRSTRSH